MALKKEIFVSGNMIYLNGQAYPNGLDMRKKDFQTVLSEIKRRTNEDVSEQDKATIQKAWSKCNQTDEIDSNILKDKNATPAEKKAFLVEELMQIMKIKTLKDTNEMLYYDSGVYRRGGETEVLIELEKLGGYEITNTMRNEILAAIRSRSYENRSAFDFDPNILNLKNGLLNIETMAFETHRPDYLSLTQLPVKYDPKASCPEIMKFLTGIVDGENLKKIIRMLGYCLLKSAKYQRAFMTVGPGSNGKGTLIKLVMALVGHENVSNKTLQDINKDRFACAELHSKMVNACADLPADMVEDAGNFKMAVSGDPMDAQRKHEHPFVFRNYAKLIFSANTIPKSKDKTYAYYRRWIIIPFRKTFVGVNDDPDLIDKLTTPQELSGLLNVALIGLKRLREENGFTEENVQKIQQIYDSNASLVRDFINDECEISLTDKNCFVESFRLQNAYEKYCEAKGARALDINVLGEELRSQGIEHKRKRGAGDRQYCYFGIRLMADVLS